MIATLFYDRMGRRPPRIANIYQEWSSANVSASRNIVTQRFLDKNDADWLLWVDADMQWSPLDVDVLLDAADPKTMPVIGGLCFGMAHGKPFPTIYHFAEIDGNLTTIRMSSYEQNAIFQVAATGAAFLLIHRSALQSMADRGFNQAFPFFQETQNGPDPVGEDLTFCLRLAALGIPVHVHTGVKIGHHKSHVITEDTFLAAQEG
jgi:GT2 family glycosyltransferase